MCVSPAAAVWPTEHTLFCKAGTQVWIMPGACTQDEPRRARTRERGILTIGSTNAGRTDEREWPAEEYRVLLDAVKPGESFRQLGVCANMRGDCRKQLDHVKKRVDPGIACMVTRGRAEFADVLLVSNAAVLKQAGYGLQFKYQHLGGRDNRPDGEVKESGPIRGTRGVERAPRPNRRPERPSRPRTHKLAHRKHGQQNSHSAPNSQRVRHGPGGKRHKTSYGN